MVPFRTMCGNHKSQTSWGPVKTKDRFVQEKHRVRANVRICARCLTLEAGSPSTMHTFQQWLGFPNLFQRLALLKVVTHGFQNLFITRWIVKPGKTHVIFAICGFLEWVVTLVLNFFSKCVLSGIEPRNCHMCGFQPLRTGKCVVSCGIMNDHGCFVKKCTWLPVKIDSQFDNFPHKMREVLEICFLQGPFWGHSCLVVPHLKKVPDFEVA